MFPDVGWWYLQSEKDLLIPRMNNHLATTSKAYNITGCPQKCSALALLVSILPVDRDPLRCMAEMEERCVERAAHHSP